MPLRTSSVGGAPSDPTVEAVAEILAEVLFGASVEVRYEPRGSSPSLPGAEAGLASAVGAGPECDVALVVSLSDRVMALVQSDGSSLGELVDTLPDAGLRVAERFRPQVATVTRDGAPRASVAPALRRVLRDAVAAEILETYLGARLHVSPRPDLIPETIEFLIELSGTRVEAHHLTHGVIVADVLHDTPRLEFQYPHDIRAAKRAPLLFDGQRSVLVVDPSGRARTELQGHRLSRLAHGTDTGHARVGDVAHSGALVAEATGALGGIGFFVRDDRTIWTFADGLPLLVRRGEHWTAFPLELTASIANMIGGGAVADLVARTALLISSQPGGAILAIVDDPSSIADVVPLKDRYDLRDEIDPDAMRPETRLHHLIDAVELDEHTLARLATLDGATVVDREGRLLAYGAIVTTTDSQHEGARTAAARTLSETAAVVLKVSVDGDITIFRDGAAVTTLLGNPQVERTN